MDLEFPTKSGKLLRCRVVNVYGPHKKLAENYQQLLIDFYGQVRDALTVPANVETFVLGDFNSKLGKMTTSDMDFGFGRFMGKFGMGSRNEMERIYWTFCQSLTCLPLTPVFATLLVIQQHTLVGERTGVLDVIAKRLYQFTLR